MKRDFSFLIFESSIIDKNYMEMCTSQQTFYYSGRYVCLNFVSSVNYFVVYKAGKRQTKTKLFFLSEARLRPR
jgi:hypothetical protein